jgi:hypothetical protein
MRYYCRLLCVTLTSVLLPVSLSQADIFQCVDQSGKTYFRDTECRPEDETKQTIAVEALIGKSNVSQPPVDNSSALGKNLIRNPSFKNQLVDWRVPLGASWSSSQGAYKSGVLIIQAPIPPDDKYIHETVVEQCVLLGPGEKFQLQGKFKSEKVFTGKLAKTAKHANRLNVIWYESTDCSVGGQYGGYAEPKNLAGWQDLKSNDIKPAFQAKAAKITIVQQGRYARGYKAYWDNIAFIASEVFEQSTDAAAENSSAFTTDKRPLNQNYVENASFKRDLESWYTPNAEWSGTGAGSAKATSKSRKGSIGSTALSQCVNLDGNTDFVFGLRVKKDSTSTQDGGGRIRVSWNDKQNCNGRSKADTNWTDVNDVSGWQAVEVSGLSAPAMARSVRLELIQTIKAKGRFSMYWDDVYFKAVASW